MCGMTLDAEERLIGTKVACYACDYHFILDAQKSAVEKRIVSSEERETKSDCINSSGEYMKNSFLLNSETDSDFVFKFTCSECGKSCLFSQYVDCQCPQCQSGMKVSDAKINISGNILKKQLWDLLLKKEQGDVAARRMLAVLSDSPDPDVRDLIEKNRYEKLRGNEFQPLMPLEPERKPEPVSEPEKNLPSSAPKKTVEVKCPYCSRKKLIHTSFLGLYIKCNVCNSTFPAKSSNRR